MTQCSISEMMATTIYIIDARIIREARGNGVAVGTHAVPALLNAASSLPYVSMATLTIRSASSGIVAGVAKLSDKRVT
jgi:hypothetical protein